MVIEIESSGKRNIEGNQVKVYKKKEMLEAVFFLQRINKTITGTGIENSGEEVGAALAECQEIALSLGNYLETKGDKGTEAVHILEEYCEQVYQMSLCCSDEQAGRNISKEIRKQLNTLEKLITYDLPDDKKEIVFLPYKASMWDSLEGVWKKVNADENCQAYVIPIPYFDKNPDGSFREMHYEGDQYPEYVPITYYKDYDIESRKPDVIYIHNPYDEYNFVTSVHPYFFSSRLKNFTGKLVYIPYFILDEIKPEEAARIDEIRHFITVPAVFHAHKVVVQSEDMKQVYVKVLLDYTKDHSGAAKKYWNNKIEGTGSPKLDKLLHTKKEDVKVPKEWLRVIEKSDGSWKKIVFYNNCISALLVKNEEMLTKIESVLRIFKEKQEEIVLLWRPHPLIESTLTSMRPQLWEKYKAIRDHYIAEGWGIYDESADIDRAIMISDAYYGDPSSVVKMYQQTGKPIMIQNAEVI